MLSAPLRTFERGLHWSGFCFDLLVRVTPYSLALLLLASLLCVRWCCFILVMLLDALVCVPFAKTIGLFHLKQAIVCLVECNLVRNSLHVLRFNALMFVWC